VRNSILFMFAFSLAITGNSCKAEQEKTSGPFVLTDAYIQFADSTPTHLAHKDARVYAYAGDDISIWIAFDVPENTKSPCSRKSNSECELVYELASKTGNEKTGRRIWAMNDRHHDEGSQNAFAIPEKIPNDFDTGDATLILKLRAKTEEFVLVSVPIEIR
jgi:hypothetical protein